MGQIFAFVGVVAGLVAYGLIRDYRERQHEEAAAKDSRKDNPAPLSSKT